MKCTIINLYQYIIAENLYFIAKFQKSCNKNNIDHSLLQFLLYNSKWTSLYPLLALNTITNNRAIFKVIFDCN